MVYLSVGLFFDQLVPDGILISFRVHNSRQDSRLASRNFLRRNLINCVAGLHVCHDCNYISKTLMQFWRLAIQPIHSILVGPISENLILLFDRTRLPARIRKQQKLGEDEIDEVLQDTLHGFHFYNPKTEVYQFNKKCS